MSSDPASCGATACAHCGLPVPAPSRTDADGPRFCCAGCRAVYGVIHAAGLERYYAVQRAVEAAGRPARTSARGFEEFDDPAFRRRACRDEGDGLSSVRLALEGVHCVACLWLIEKLPVVVAGVAEARLDLRRRIVRIVWDDAVTPLSCIARRLAAFGYVPHVVSGRRQEELRRNEDRVALVRIAVAGALAGNVMLIAFALYGGMFHGIDAAHHQLFRWTSLGLTMIALAWPGRVFFRSAWHALLARTLHMDVPIATGLAAGAAWSATATVRGVGDVYFDSITLLVFLLLVGRWVQLRQQRASVDAIEQLFSLTPRHARLVEEDAAPRDVPADSLRPGQIVEVRAGETVPADGFVVDGSSSLNRAWLTGESRPVHVADGAAVHAGSTSLTGRLLVRVDAAGDATRAARLMHLVDDAARRRAPIVGLADRIAGIFVAVVLMLAAATALTWWRIDEARAIENAVALLIITCPCALGLATPLAIVAAIGRAARAGILIKGGDTVQALSRRGGLLLLDKTGTITTGRVVLLRWHGPRALQRTVAALEAHASHPIAEALVAAVDDGSAEGLAVSGVRVLDNGVAGTVDGRRVVVGSPRCIEASRAELPPWARREADAVVREGATPVLAAVDGRVEAVAALGDSMRDGARRAIAAMRRAGWQVEIVSGDHPEVVRRVAVELGLDPARCQGAVTPEEKLGIVERAAAAGTVVMVGDGVNDAAALAAATVGVAVEGGAEASLAAADVYLGRHGLAALPTLSRGAARTMRVIRRGLLISLAYNLVGVSLAVAGLITPLVAAILMPISSLTVMTLALRARTFEVEPCP